MKTRITTLAGALACAAALLPTNQAPAQAARPASTVSLVDFRNQLYQLQADITATVSSLNVVKGCAKKPTELAKAAAELNTTFDSLQARVEMLRTNAVTVKARVKDHYDAWSKELTSIQNADLREKAQDRLTRSQKEFDKIIAEAGTAKEKLLPFVSSVKDIVIYLNADLSEDAAKSLSKNIWKVDNSSKSVKSSVTDLIQQIDTTVKSLPQR